MRVPNYGLCTGQSSSKMTSLLFSRIAKFSKVEGKSRTDENRKYEIS